MHVYFAFEITASLTAPQKAQAAQAFADIGPSNDINPARNIHFRQRPDGQAWLVEANFPGTPTKAQVVTALANRLGISAATLNANTTFTGFAINSDHETSRSAAAAFLANNRSAWAEDSA
jgi:hypothetical protein